MIRNETETRNNLLAKASNYRLVEAMRILCSVKVPAFIPYLEVLTYSQVAEYYHVSEKRIRGIVARERKWFLNDCFLLKKPDVEGLAISAKNLSDYFACAYTFANGVTVSIPHAGITAFNGRAVLCFAMFLHEESAVAESLRAAVFDVLNGTRKESEFDNVKPWTGYRTPRIDGKPVSDAVKDSESEVISEIEETVKIEETTEVEVIQESAPEATSAFPFEGLQLTITLNGRSAQVTL